MNTIAPPTDTHTSPRGIGIVYRVAREQAGLSIEELCDLTDGALTAADLALLESGTCLWSTDALATVDAALERVGAGDGPFWDRVFSRL